MLFIMKASYPEVEDEILNKMISFNSEVIGFVYYIVSYQIINLFIVGIYYNDYRTD